MKFTCFITCIFICISCQNISKKTSEQDLIIPALLDRSSLLSYGAEWTNVQNDYVRCSLHQNAESLLLLSELFIREARITGEHGHYYPAAKQVLSHLDHVDDLSEDSAFRKLLNLATVELSQHQFESALASGQKALDLNPYNSKVYGILVDAHVELGHYKEAIAMADQMMSIRPGINSYARISYLREMLGLHDGAIQAMELAVNAAYPGSEEAAWAQLQLGKLYLSFDRLEDAKRQFEDILVHRPNYGFALEQLSEIAMIHNNLDQAEYLLKQACMMMPEVGFYIGLAKVYQSKGLDNLYKSTVQQIISMLEDDVSHGHNMNMEYAQLYLDLLNDPERALPYVQLEYDSRPMNRDVNMLLGKIYREMGELNQALAYEKAAEIVLSL